ncbi:unnamed protein product [Rhizoctonia solani]|uniref:Vegetative incompatibility protein HET-E-1 n=1 Tax=Rhizoctonia solani TaxID=456999 RepID=A0A8H3AFS5_9AGAM|nr:unnamed protein product [Rhizoctonia solani]
MKFIVSSRPEPQIRDEMTEEQVESRLVLHELDTGEVQADIRTYLEDELKQMKSPPATEQVIALVERAGILFIYAATAVRYIGYDNFRRNPNGRLRALLDVSRTGTKKTEEIDQLYMTILEAALSDPGLEEDERDDMEQVLRTVVCAREPLTVRSLSELLQIHDVERIQAALRPLWSVLHVFGENELVTTLHASFPDFMFDSARSKAYYCDPISHNYKLAERCFDQIKLLRPRFNLCSLESSYLPDDEVHHIKERVANAVSPELLYACRYWAGHIKAGNCASSMVEYLRDFLTQRLLVWMEVLNLKKQIKAGKECMKLMIEWQNELLGHEDIVELAYDAQKFVDIFASNPVSQSTPHIYVSMLKFWPESSPMAKCYIEFSQGPVQVDGTALDRRQSAHLSTWVFESSVDAMTVSPDGLHAALALDNEVVLVDLSNGVAVLGPLKANTHKIESVAFSPNGNRVVAGSLGTGDGGGICAYSPGRWEPQGKDVMILGWDTRTGEKIIGPITLNGRGHGVICLSFSPDLSRIATGTLDHMVYMWSVEDGKMLYRFEAKTTVGTTVFSPEGARTTTGTYEATDIWDSQTGSTTPRRPFNAPRIEKITHSSDGSRIVGITYELHNSAICIWDTQNGDMILGPMEKPTSARSYTAIGYSPDGRFIVAADYDRTIWVWSTQAGKLVLGPLRVHTGSISTLALSPDGSRIFSGCENGIVCTWGSQQRNLVSISNSTNDPFDDINCAKFSSDGTRFVTGSTNGTVGIWSTYDTGEMGIVPAKVQTGQINAIDFFENRVVSSSNDGKICVYDALSGKPVLGPLDIGLGWIPALSYSPNGKLIATGSNNKVDLWDAQNGTRVLGPFTDLSGCVTSVRFSPDGTHITGCSDDSSSNIIVWDVSNGRNMFGALDGHHDSVHSISYSPNGALIASGSSDDTIILWDAYTGKGALSSPIEHLGSVNGVSFSPNSTRLASSSWRSILIYDVQTGHKLFELLSGHEDGIISVEYSPDSTRILSLSWDMSVRIHDARSPDERALSRSASVSEIGDWAINDDGWVVDDQSRLLVWVPANLRRALMSPSTMQNMVGPQGYVRLKFDKSHMGEAWADSYTSQL